LSIFFYSMYMYSILETGTTRHRCLIV
jgi:hypothetical protein